MKFSDNRKINKLVLMYLFQRLLDTYMLNGGHLKLLCIQCLEFFYFHSLPEAILLCDWQMCSGRVRHIVAHVKTLMSVDPDQHS